MNRMYWFAAALAAGATMSFGSCASLRFAHLNTFDGWSDLTSDHFHLQTPMEPKAAEKLLLNLEHYREAFQLALGFELKTKARLDVVALTRSGALHQMGLPEGAVGYLDSSGEPMMALEPASRSTDSVMNEVLAHELAHYFLAFVFPRQPRWFSEGMADYLGSVRLSADMKHAVVGLLNPLRLHNLRSCMRLEDLWAWDGRRAEMAPNEKVRAYESAWRWVHYLTNVHPQRFAAFMQELVAGAEPQPAFDRTFAGIGRNELNQGASDFLGPNQKFEVVQLPLHLSPTSISLESLAPLEALWALFQVSRSGDFDDWLLAKATQRFPNSTEALLLAADASLAKDGVLPAALLEHLLKPDRLSDTRVARFLASNVKGLSTEELDLVSRRAVELAPQSPVALEARIRFLTTAGRANETLELVRAMIRTAPFSMAGLFSAAKALSAAGVCADAAMVFDRASALLLDERRAAEEPGEIDLKKEGEDALSACLPREGLPNSIHE